MNISLLGESRFDSPIPRTINDSARVPLDIIQEPGRLPRDISFELAGPRRKLFFDPAKTHAAIVTCGGLSPGLNNVIRSVYLELHHAYGVHDLLGFRNGYGGLLPDASPGPMAINGYVVDRIHRAGGTIIGTSRGPVDVQKAVENLLRLKIDILFTVGGDGTQRGGNDLYQEAKRRGHALSVVGIPKTMDNDIAFVARSFGFLSAVRAAAHVLDCAHTEAQGVHNGIVIVKLMGRHAGFVTAAATVSSQDVNFALVPEVPFVLDGERGLLAALERRVLARQHALVVVAEGAGQDLMGGGSGAKDASGNVRFQDIGPFLCRNIEEHFRGKKIPFTLRYIEPSYTIRSVPADAEDAILCDMFSRNAVHAAMAGKTGLVIGLVHDQYVHVPIDMLASEKKRLDPSGSAWHAVLASTGQAGELSGQFVG